LFAINPKPVKKIILIWVVLALTSGKLVSSNAPISTVGTIITNGTMAIVPITAINFTNIASCNLKLLYNPAIVAVSSVTTGPGLGGYLSTDLNVPGIISLGWATYPGVTLPGNPVIFNITFTKVAWGTSAIAWSDDGYSCIWSDGNFTELNDLPTSTYYLNGSVTFAGTLAAEFTAGNTTPPKNTTIQFTDLTTGGPSTWDWSFDRTSIAYVNGTNAHSQNPKVQFTDGGSYTVTLVVHNAISSDTKIKTGYIWAGTPGLWTGAVSSDWATADNWDDWRVPASTTDVVVSSDPSSWPVYTDLTLGVTCNSLTLNGSSQVHVTGNFTINAGSSLNFTGNGNLKVDGNWTNAGSFNAGTGTVEFTGTGPASIISGGSPPVMNNFYNLKISKTGATLTIPPEITITVNRDLTINP
jgi:PKD repeat protein